MSYCGYDFETSHTHHNNCSTNWLSMSDNCGHSEALIHPVLGWIIESMSNVVKDKPQLYIEIEYKICLRCNKKLGCC